MAVPKVFVFAVLIVAVTSMVHAQPARPPFPPSQVAIYVSRVSGLQHLCHGAAISPRWVISAATCVAEYARGRVHLLRLVYPATNGGMHGDISHKILVPLQFNRQTRLNNIAMLWVILRRSQNFQPAVLPTVRLPDAPNNNLVLGIVAQRVCISVALMK